LVEILGDRRIYIMGKSNNPGKVEVAGMVLYSLKELHTLTGVTTEAWLGMLNTGKIQGRMLGGLWRTSDAALKEYMESNPVEKKKTS